MEHICILIHKEEHNGAYYYQAMMNPDVRGKKCNRIEDALYSFATILKERIADERNRLEHTEDFCNRLVQEPVSLVPSRVLEEFKLSPTSFVQIDYQYEIGDTGGSITIPHY